MPSSVSSKTRQSSGATPSRSAASKEAVRSGFAVRVVFSADDRIEFVEKTEGSQRPDDRTATAAGDDGERNPAVLCQDVLEHLGNGFELRKLLVIETLFARGHRFDRHIEAVASD